MGACISREVPNALTALSDALHEIEAEGRLGSSSCWLPCRRALPKAEVCCLGQDHPARRDDDGRAAGGHAGDGCGHPHLRGPSGQSYVPATGVPCLWADKLGVLAELGMRAPSLCTAAAQSGLPCLGV